VRFKGLQFIIHCPAALVRRDRDDRRPSSERGR